MMRTKTPGERLGTALLVLGLGCAEGYAGPDEAAAPLSDVGTGAVMAGVPAAGDGSGTGGEASPPVFSGDPCQRGESQACLCEGGGEGTRVCKVNAASPTGGAFGPCEACSAPPPPPTAGMGASTGGMDASTGGTGAGTGGTSASTGGMGAGTAGMSSGSGGMGSGSGGSSGEVCNPDTCDEPRIGEVCCTDSGRCGYRLISSCLPQL